MNSTVLPCALLPFLLRRFGVGEARIVIGGLILLLMASLVKINYYYNRPMSKYQYYAASVVFFSATLIIETGIVPLAVKSIPPRYATGFWGAGMVINTSDVLGRLLGSAAFTVYSQFDRRGDEYGALCEPFYAYIVNSVVVGFLLVGTLISHKKLEKHMKFKVLLNN